LGSNVVESPATPPRIAEPPMIRPNADNRPARGNLAILAPTVAAGLALAVHRMVPDSRLPPMSWLDALPAWKHPYPVVLCVLIAASILSVLSWASWKPMRPLVRYYSPLVAGGLVVLTLWELFTVKLNWLPEPFFPPPDEVLGGLIEDRDLLLTSLRHSLVLLFTGYGVGVLAGFISGVVIGWFPLGRYWGMPVLKLVGPVPATMLVIVAMTFSSSAFVNGVMVLAYAVWFPMSMLTSSGIANVRVSYLDVARTLGAGQRYLVLNVAIPAAMPNVFLGLFVGLLTSFLTLPVAESVGVQAGLGWYIPWRKGVGDYDKVYAALLIMSVLYSLLLTLLFKVRNWMLRWQKGIIKW
jgi:NitT/TauT family transport system permease protein